MSSASKVTLTVSVTASLSIIAFVHWAQQDDRRKLRLGVIRDQERQEGKRRNEEELREQQRLQALLQEKEEKDLKT